MCLFSSENWEIKTVSVLLLRRRVAELFHWLKMDSLRDFVLSRRFDAFILFVIIVNTAILTIQRPGETQQRPVRQLESFCTFVFIVELFLKLAGLGISEYFGNVWNRLDFFVVLESIIGIIMVCK